VYVRLKPNDNCKKGLVKQKLSDRSYAVEVGVNSYRRNREHMIPFQSKTVAVFDNLGDGTEPIESTKMQKQDDDVRASKMKVNLDEQPPAPRVEGMGVETSVETARPKRETCKPRWLNDYME
jgi:hypothetical protein